MVCPVCGSTNIERKNDSKWLFTVHTEAELTTLIAGVDRVLLLIGDHPNFDNGDYATLRFQAFEIWPKTDRARHFRSIMEGYYRNIYLPHIAERPEKTPAPKNFWPYSFQFYMCNPVKTFQATVTDSLSDPRIRIDHYVDPFADRVSLPSELLPPSVLQAEEVLQLSALPDEVLLSLLIEGHSPSEFRSKIRYRDATALLRPLDEVARTNLMLRQTDVPVSHTGTYRRRSLTTE